MGSKTHRVEVRIDGKINYAQDVTHYSIHHQDGQLILTAGDTELDIVTETDEPLVPPPPSPGAPDGHDEETDEPDPTPVRQSVHTGVRDRAAEDAAAESRRSARRKAAEESAAPAVDGPTGTIVDGVLDVKPDDLITETAVPADTPDTAGGDTE